MQEKAICSECEHCKSIGTGRYATRSNFYCEHPDRGYIEQYYKENKINKALAFIDYSKPYEKAPAIKTSPKWCPRKAGNSGRRTQ